MAQRFLSITNFEKYQRDSKRTYPWVPLYKKLLVNPDFLKLDINSRYIYVCLILIGSDCGNKIPNDVSYLAHRCSMDVSQLNLKPLYRYGFLQASKTTKWRLDREERRGEEKRGDEIARADQVVAQPSRQLTDDEWLVSHVRANPAYTHINIDQELGKMDAWLSTRPQKKKTRRFIVNWLNRIEKPMSGGNGQPVINRPPPPPPKTHVIERGLWKQNYGDPKQYGYD
jgi:hypothetical protein